MATYATANAIGQREDLSDIIYRIDPTETPLVTAMSKETTSGVTTEWQVQELAAAVDTNYVNEGADYSYVNPTATTRLNNIHQISASAAQISGTLDSVDTAGRAKESAYVKVIKGLEQRRDIEKSLFKNEAKSGSDPRKTAKLLTWITNGSKPGDMGFAAGTGADTVGSVSLYLSDFGTLDAVVDRQCSDSEMYVIDKDYVCLCFLPGRQFSVSDVAPTGDTTKFSIISEYALIVKAPKAHAAIIGLNGS